MNGQATRTLYEYFNNQRRHKLHLQTKSSEMLEVLGSGKPKILIYLPNNGGLEASVIILNFFPGSNPNSLT